MGKWKEMIEDRYLKKLDELTRELKKEKQKIRVLTAEEVEEFYKEKEEEDLNDHIRSIF